MDKFAQIEFQSMLLSLVEMLETYDLGDEIGRDNLKELISHLLRECLLDPKIVAVLVRCMEQLVSDVTARMQYFLTIIYDICELHTKQNDLVHDRELTDMLLENVETSLVMKIRSLKVRILDLEEMEENFVRQKEYMRAQAVTNERMIVTDEYRDLIQPLLEKHGELQLPTRPKLSKQERVLKGLYISFYMVASEHVHSLNPSLCKLYKVMRLLYMILEQTLHPFPFAIAGLHLPLFAFDGAGYLRVVHEVRHHVQHSVRGVHQGSVRRAGR